MLDDDAGGFLAGVKTLDLFPSRIGVGDIVEAQLLADLGNPIRVAGAVGQVA